MTDIPAPLPAATTPTAGISLDTSRLGSAANLKKAGEKFEAVFIGLMMKSMRQAKLTSDDDNPFYNKDQDTFRDMQDKKVAESMAAHQPIGIGKAMTEFLAKSQAALQPGTPAADAASTPS